MSAQDVRDYVGLCYECPCLYLHLPGHEGQHCPGRMVGLAQPGTGQVISAHISRPLWQ